jgi:hypothetical protein
VNRIRATPLGGVGTAVTQGLSGFYPGRTPRSGRITAVTQGVTLPGMPGRSTEVWRTRIRQIANSGRQTCTTAWFKAERLDFPPRPVKIAHDVLEPGNRLFVRAEQTTAHVVFAHHHVGVIIGQPVGLDPSFWFILQQ